MKALVVLKDLINGKKESFANNMTVDEAEAFVVEAIKEIEQLQDKLSKAQLYIIELEERLKYKEDNGWRNK